MREIHVGMDASEEPLDIIIVGAGVAGLQALRECREIGVRARVLERDAVAGGKWSGHGIYDCVQIQQHRDDFFLPGAPWPNSTPSFATRDDMVGVTSRYISCNDLESSIDFRSNVVGMTFDKSKGLWATTTAAGSVWTSRFVAWAVGTLGPPNMPGQVKEALAGFCGEVDHSHAYFRPNSYEGQDVIVLGYGASSVEIAQDLAKRGRCASVTVVAPPKVVSSDGKRQGQDWCLSRTLPGQGSRFCAQGQSGDDATLEARNACVASAMKAKYTKYPECLPQPFRPTGTLDGRVIYPGEDGRPLGGRVIVSEGFLECVSDGRITCHPGYLGGSDAAHVTVTHEGSSMKLKADAVVVCTGYLPPTACIQPLMTPAPKSCETLYKAMWMADVPNAAVIGHIYGFVAVPPFAGLQAKFLARVVAGKEVLPPSVEMKQWVAHVEAKYSVTQRLTENHYFTEMRAAALGGEEMRQHPIGAGPPNSDKVALTTISRPAKSAKTTPTTADNSIATAAAEALFFLDESRGGAVKTALSEIALLVVGGGGIGVAEAFQARLRPSEHTLLITTEEEALSGPWKSADSSADLLICNGPLNDTAANVQFVREALRVLKPGGHAIVMLRGEANTAASWTALFDEHERPAAQIGQKRWKLVHKTVPKPHAQGGDYRQFVFRVKAPAGVPLHLRGAGGKASTPAADDLPEPQGLFAWSSDFYTSMQSAFDTEIKAVLARRRDEAVDSDVVCGGGEGTIVPATLDEIVARFDSTGNLISDVGLLPPVESVGAESGEAAGRMLAAAYLPKLEGDVIKDELRLQAGNMIGHMAGSLPPWVAPVGRLVNFLHCNNVKVETGKTSTYMEREVMAAMHKTFYGFEDDFYRTHSMADGVCLGHPCSGGTVANLEALWTARNSAHPGCDQEGVNSDKEGVVLISELGHYSLSKAIDVLGLGTSSVISVPTQAFKMDVAALAAKLDELKHAKRKVVAIIAVAGTTEAGSFDPIRQIAALAKAHGVWLHVDAAWAGGLIFSPSTASLFDGIELAGSITVDAHKSLFAPMGFGMVLYRDPHASAAIVKTAKYIIRKDSPDLGKYSLEGSRPAQVLHLHASLRALGKNGLKAVMDHKLQVASEFARLIEADNGFELMLHPESDILLFRALKPASTNGAKSKARDAPDPVEDEAVADECNEMEIDAYNVQLQEAQKRMGRTFVSRTALMDPRRGQGMAKGTRPTKTTVLRVVINAQVTLDNCKAVLEDLRILGIALALDPAPLSEARTLTQALAHAMMTVPHAVAVRTADPKPPPSAAVGAKMAALGAGKTFARAIPESETGGGAADRGSLTYWQLLHEAVHISSHLLSPRSQKGSVVAILCDRNVDAYVAIVACLLRGCAWLMIDSSLPAARVAYLLTEATPMAEVLISDSRRATWEAAIAKMGAKAGERTLQPCFLTPFLYDLRLDKTSEERTPIALPAPVSPDDATKSDAYMIFTSGSTGMPKAVKISHMQLCNMLRAFATHWGAHMEAGKDSAVAQIAWAWDMHVLDMWLGLAQGATVRLLRDEERLDGARVAAVIDRTASEADERGGALRWMQGTPSFYRTLLSGGWLGDGGHGLTCISSGEPMPTDLARALLLRCNKLINCYGLTECTIFQSFEELKLPEVIQRDCLARDPETNQLRLPDISCGRACYSYANDDKCEVVLCRVAEGELPPAEEGEEGSEKEDPALRRAKEVKHGVKLEKISATDVVGQVCFAGTCLPRKGYHNAPELNGSKFVDYPSTAEGNQSMAKRAKGNQSMTSMVSGTSNLTSSLSDSGSHSSDNDGWVDVHQPSRKHRPPQMMLSGDLGVWRPDGKLQILGRVDGMVKVLGSRVDISEVQTALCDHDSLVSDAAVVAIGKDGGSKELVAYFVPTAGANAQAARDGLSGVADEVDLWESIYDDAYVKKDAVGAAHDENHAIGHRVDENKGYDDALLGLSAEVLSDMITNWSAYISSYSGKLWPRSTIEHWVNATVDRFLDMKPKRMLEVGSGNGMLAFRAALRPEIEEVWMADLSGEACRYVEKVKNHPYFKHIEHKCKVFHRPAHDFSGIPDDHFDVIVMNAMTMYFPSTEYFADVLRKCSKALRLGGCVYIGCNRSLEHLQHFHTDVTLFNANDNTVSALELRKACLSRRMKEKELLTSPDYFYRHKETLPGCFDKVAVLLRRGYDCPKVGEKGADPRHVDAPVEMTRWRYDVWLLKGALPAERGVTIPLHEAPKPGKIPKSGSTERLQMIEELNFEGQKTLDEAISRMVSDSGSADALTSYLVRNVPNARTLDAVACELVIDGVITEGERRGTAATVGDVRRAIKAKIKNELAASNDGVGVCPEAFLEYVERVGAGKLGAQMIFTPSAFADANTAAAGTNSAAHLFDVLIYALRDDGPSPQARAQAAAMRLREARFRTGDLSTLVDYGRMQIAPLLSRLSPIELGAKIQRRDQGGNSRHEECYGNKRNFSGVQRALTVSLRESLPSFAVPKCFVPVNVLPLLPTGKTDKRHLPSAYAAVLTGQSERTAVFRAPTTPTETLLVGLFSQYITGGNAEVNVGVDDDFGELGGNSLSAGRLVAACTRSFGINLAMGDVFEMRTPARIATAIDALVAALSEDEKAQAGAAAAKSLHAALVHDDTACVKVIVYDTFIPVPTASKLGEHCVDDAAESDVTMLQARIWRSEPVAGREAEDIALIDFAPYPLSFMTTNVDDATLHPLAARGLTCVRVQARGTDRSRGVCGDPYDFAAVHVPDLVATIQRVTKCGLAAGVSSGEIVAPAISGFRSVVLHGFSWAATAALRVISLPDSVRPAAIKAACLCMGNDELHESDAFFERRVPLAFNFMWSSQFEAIMARPPTDLAADPSTGAQWQQRWIERLDSFGNLPAKYLRAVRDPSKDPTWKPHSLSCQADPAVEGLLKDDALLAGLGKVAVPVLAAGAGSLGRYGDTVERLVRSRGVAEAQGKPLPEVRGILGPWVHAFPHLSAVGPNVDWVGMVTSFAQRHTASAPPTPESSLIFYETEQIPLGPSLPMRWPGQYHVVSATELATGAGPNPSAPCVTLAATPAGALVDKRSSPLCKDPAMEVGTVSDNEIVGQMGGEWFSWGIGADLAVDQKSDDDKSLCFDMAVGGACTVRGTPVVRVTLAEQAARRALSARTSGLDCLIARLCVVDESGTSRLAAVGAASLTLAEPITDTRAGARNDSPPLATLEISLHFMGLTIAPSQKLRLALSSSYFPLFLAPGGYGPSPLTSVELDLPNVGGTPVEMPPPEMTTYPTTLQRLRAPRHQRTALASGGLGSHVLQDDGTVRMDDGLAVSTRSDMYVEVLSGRRLQVTTMTHTTLTRGSEFARLEVKTSLKGGREDTRDVVVDSTIEATACGASLWRKSVAQQLTI